MEPVDVLVAGGGPAGLASGILLARRGLRVVVCERGRYPVDKPCGEGIMPLGVRHLRELQIWIRQAHPFCGVHYYLGEHEAVGSFREGPGLGVRRLELSRALFERAAETAGLEVRQATRATPLERTPRGIVVDAAGRRVRARLLVGADGLASGVRRWAGLDGGAGSWQRWGARAHFAVPPWNNRVEVHWAPGLEAYVTPVSDRQVGVAFCWDRRLHPAVPGRRQLLAFLLAPFPAVRRRLGPALDSLSAVGPLQRRCRRPAAAGLALVGDASGYLDPLTGEGISLALGQALALEKSVAEPLLREDGPVPERALERYEAAHRALLRPYYLVTGSLLWLTHHPALARRVVRALARDPASFALLLSANMGLARWPELVLRLPLLLVRLAFGGP